MRLVFSFFLIGASSLLALDAPAQVPGEPVLVSASSHPMQYFISLPSGWSRDKKWPVVITIEGSNKDFEGMARDFAEARRSRPFIIVTPLVLTNGGSDLKSLPNYHYSDTTWDRIAREGKCKFDFDGLAAIIADVKNKYGGEDRVFITGHSGGAQLTWAIVFQHPEALAGAAPTCGNYTGRCMTEGNFSNAQGRSELPIKGFEGDQDHARPGLESQFRTAAALAKEHGYLNISLVTVHGGHEPFPDVVLSYFESLFVSSGKALR